MMRFKRQLEEKTQMLQADISTQKKELKQMKEQLNTLQDSKSQVRDQFYVSGRKKGTFFKELVNRVC